MRRELLRRVILGHTVEYREAEKGVFLAGRLVRPAKNWKASIRWLRRIEALLLKGRTVDEIVRHGAEPPETEAERQKRLAELEESRLRRAEEEERRWEEAAQRRQAAQQGSPTPAVGDPEDMREVGELLLHVELEIGRRVLEKHPEANIVAELHSGNGLPEDPTPVQVWIARFDRNVRGPYSRATNGEKWPEATRRWFEQHAHLADQFDPSA